MVLDWGCPDKGWWLTEAGVNQGYSGLRLMWTTGTLD